MPLVLDNGKLAAFIEFGENDGAPTLHRRAQRNTPPVPLNGAPERSSRSAAGQCGTASPKQGLVDEHFLVVGPAAGRAVAHS
jgi:hypothetical protein